MRLAQWHQTLLLLLLVGMAIVGCGRDDASATKSLDQESLTAQKTGAFYPELPDTIRSSSGDFSLPMEFADERTLSDWINRTKIACSKTTITVEGRRAKLLGFHGFSGRRAIILVGVAQEGSKWFTFYANQDGVDLTANLDKAFSADLDSSGMLSLVSNDSIVARVPFSRAAKAASMAVERASD